MRTADQSRRDSAIGWVALMVIGVLLVIGGAFALYASVLTTFVSIIYLGVMLIVIGVLEAVFAFQRRHSPPWFVYLLAGLLAIVCGGLMLSRPLATVLTVSLLIAGYLFASGLFRGITALGERYPQWGWDFAYSLVAIVCGIYLVASWPISSFWLLGTLVAIEIIARGATLIAAAWVVRDVEHRHIRAAGAT